MNLNPGASSKSSDWGLSRSIRIPLSAVSSRLTLFVVKIGRLSRILAGLNRCATQPLWRRFLRKACDVVTSWALVGIRLGSFPAYIELKWIFQHGSILSTYIISILSKFSTLTFSNKAFYNCKCTFFLRIDAKNTKL